MSALIGDMGRREGIEDFGWRASSPQLEQIPVMSGKIRSSPTLLSALESACSHGRAESSKIQIWIERRKDSILFCYRGSVEVGAPGADDIASMQARVFLSIVRLFAGPNWAPADAALARCAEPGPIVREELGSTRIRLAPDYSWHRLPRSILSLGPRALPAAAAWSGSEVIPDQASDLVGSLALALRPYLPTGVPSLRDAAELVGMSVRTLQRELSCAGSSYRDIVQGVKLNAARELLERPDVRVLDVAFETGFRDPAHFTRFFRKLTGVTPHAYRSPHLEGAA
jgi:AraC-like DNA-binding protein